MQPAARVAYLVRGELGTEGFRHYRLNQIDLTGTSGIAPFFLAQTRLVDIALQDPNADPGRLGAMATAARTVGSTDAAGRLADLVLRVGGIVGTAVGTASA